MWENNKQIHESIRESSATGKVHIKLTHMKTGAVVEGIEDRANKASLKAKLLKELKAEVEKISKQPKKKTSAADLL